MDGHLRISRVHYPVTALGPGTRLGIWVQGCPLACAGCMSRDTWDPEGGHAVTVTELLGLWRDALQAGAEGLTVSGGEPLEQPHALARLLDGATRARSALTAERGPAESREPDILLYTGYTEEELDADRLAAVASADALITGRFDVTAPTGLIWRGSAGQRIVPRTDLGRRRYAPYLTYVPERVPLQVLPDATGVRLIGVPRVGALATLERDLRDAGATVAGMTWRPSRRR